MTMVAVHEARTDAELVDALVAEGIYEPGAAEEAVAIVRGYLPPAD